MRDVLADAAFRLGSDFEARVIVEEALGLPPGQLALVPPGRTPTHREAELIERAVAQRLRGVPLQYVIGRWEFYGLTLALERGVLIPRPETEGLVGEVLARVPAAATGRGVDLGTGTGCIALAIARARPGLAMEAWDVDPRAVRLARRNARLSRIALDVREADLTKGEVTGRAFVLVVSNPPYIARGDLPHLDPSVRDHEPHRALDGGADGLELVRAVLDRAARTLVPGGLVALEIGWDQGPRARALAEERGFAGVEVLPDLAKKDRVVVARWPS